MLTELHWVDGPWTGRLAVAARPRGGDWLEDEVTTWHRAGVQSVLSLLTPEEECDLDLINEARVVTGNGLVFRSLPIPDRQVPPSDSVLSKTLAEIDADLASGQNVVVHCRQGIGRTGLVAVCLLLTKGIDPEEAIRRVSAARGLTVPETEEQRRWIDHYAATAATAR
jgi:protein-tyrosine phosphatase